MARNSSWSELNTEVEQLTLDQARVAEKCPNCEMKVPAGSVNRMEMFEGNFAFDCPYCRWLDAE